MCRGFQQNDRDLLKIKAFHVHLSLSSLKQHAASHSHDSLTLHFLPRINGCPLEIDGSKVRPDTPGFVTLHRVLSPDHAPTPAALIAYASRQRLRVSEGSRFEIYAASDVKLFKGVFRKDDDDDAAGRNCWKLDCETTDQRTAEFLLKAAVRLDVEGPHAVAVMAEKVRIVGRRRRCSRRWSYLEEIPEQREGVEGELSDPAQGSADGGCCSCWECDWLKEDVADCKMDGGVRWALDVGVWVMCLGFGYLVSKASCSRIIGQRRRLLWPT